MRRRKPSDAEPTFTAHSHVLSGVAKERLKELLGVSPGDSPQQCMAQESAIANVANWLGFYPEAIKHVDRAPIPSDYVAKFEPMHESARELLESVAIISGYYIEALKEHGVDLNETELAIAKLASAAHHIAEKYRAMPNPKGARRNTALKRTILELRIAFRGAYRGPVATRGRRGAFESLSPQEKAESEFVKVALIDAKIIKKNYTGLKSLLADPECTPRTDRSKVIERIAKKGARRK